MSELVKYELRYKETRLFVQSDKDFRKTALEELIRQYTFLEGCIQKNPLFLSSYEPVSVENDAPEIAARMASAAEKAGVGPMAAVAGTMSDLVGEFLEKKGAKEYIVENGGDIAIKIEEERTVGLHAGPSVFSERIAFRLKPEETPIGICTSSGSVGHSISLGMCDAATVFGDDACTADAVATALGNKVRKTKEMGDALDYALSIEGVRGALVIKGDTLGAKGEVPEMIKIQGNKIR